MNMNANSECVEKSSRLESLKIFLYPTLLFWSNVDIPFAIVLEQCLEHPFPLPKTKFKFYIHNVKLFGVVQLIPFRYILF